MFLRIAAFIALSSVVSGAQVARPKLNDLEIRKHVMIASAISDNESSVKTFTDEAAVAAKTAQEAKDKFDANQDAAKVLALMKTKLLTEKKSKSAQDALSAGKDRQVQLQNQTADWDVTVLQSHDADQAKYKVDWDAGSIVAR